MPVFDKKLHKDTNGDLIADEHEAIDEYQRAISQSDNPDAIETYEHIKGEEQEHIEELEELDKMRADDITSEEAWEDFKSGYSDFEEKHIGKGRDGDQATLEEKVDIMNAKMSELATDISRLTDSVPQALGTIEEGKTLEEEAEDGEEDLFGGEDDGLSEFFGDDEGIEEEGDAEGFADEGEEDEDGDFVEDEDSSEESDVMADEKETDEEFSEDGESEEFVDDEEVSEETDESDDVGEEDDGDYIPIDELTDDEGEEEEKTDEEEVIEKMVAILDRMDKRIAHLERENIGLKKMLSERTVQTEPRNLAKSRPTLNTNLKMVKGSYNRPPVSTQYVANQRDIGIGKKKTESGNTSVFGRQLNDVFEECNRIANQTP